MLKNKYKNIRPVIDTGCSKSNYAIYLREKFKDMLIKENEGFKRIKVKSLISIMEDIHLVIEQLNSYMTKDTINKENFENPILLLDVRGYQEYKLCHIKGAINYPHTFLFRGANQYSNEILKYKNKKDRLIIIYDENERLAQKVAQGLLERNIQNCFMLSGGIVAIVRDYPEYIIGEIPKEIKEKITNKLENEKKNIHKITRSFIPMDYEFKSYDINRYNGHSLPIPTKKSINSYDGMNIRHSRSPSQFSSTSTSSSKSSQKNLIHLNTSHLPSPPPSRSPSQLSISSTSSKSSYTQNSEKKFERITYYSDLKKHQPITDPFAISMIKKNIPMTLFKDLDKNQKNTCKSRPPSPPPLVNTNYHALWRIKPKPITEKITAIKMGNINNKR
ncbi:Rhodanese-like protein [Piromyces finnis]|uniref:Rhodanese-like protein n=1 Tax=Piromyces finnis TaxID=1754191 RepID=A0A1Y1VEB8_9FUNG|nr:Rhodanese-like protein [Piromyces finnis]|eukprot:ORX53316.1 Rhodanese-like protein [Piromyces finnis]